MKNVLSHFWVIGGILNVNISIFVNILEWDDGAYYVNQFMKFKKGNQISGEWEDYSMA